MIKKILNKIWGTEGHEYIKNSVDKKVEFKLTYSSQPVGYLTWSEGVWHFRYSNEFKLQQKIQPLIDFPNKDEKYESKFLWPFFSYRIPGLNQPAVKHIIKRDHVETNEVELLKKFGRNSIYNPFLLQPT